MKAKLERLRLAATLLCACLFSQAFADEVTFRNYRLAWTPPTENEDGSPLTDLLGYCIYTGESPDNLWLTYFAGPQTASIDLSFVALGPRYFAVAAVNVDGFESSLSQVLSDSPE
jgi:hypothetical protein